MILFMGGGFRSSDDGDLGWLRRSRGFANRFWASLGRLLPPRLISQLALSVFFLLALPMCVASAANHPISLALPHLVPPIKSAGVAGYGNGPCGLPMEAFSRSYRSPVPVKNKWVSIGRAFGSPITVYVGPPFGKNTVGPAISPHRLQSRAIAAIVRLYVRHYAPGTTICGKDFCERLEIYCRYFVTAAGIKTSLLNSVNKGVDAVVLPAIIGWYKARQHVPNAVFPGYEGKVYPSLAVATWALNLNRSKPPEFATFWEQGLILVRLTQAACEIRKHRPGFVANRVRIPEMTTAKPAGWLSKRQASRVQTFIAISKTEVAQAVLHDIAKRKTLILDRRLRVLIRKRLEHIVKGGTRSPVNGSPAQP